MNRTRNKTEQGAIGVMTHTSNTASISPPVSTAMYSVSDTMSDVVTPGWPMPIKLGEVVNNPCSKVKTTIYKTGGGSYYATRVSNPSLYSAVSGSGSLTTFYRVLLSVGFYSVSLNGNTDGTRSAQSKALAAIDKSPYAFAEDIATIRQTVRSMVRPLKALEELIYDFYRAVKRLRKRKKTMSLARAIALTWLEFRFAIAPLVRSLTNLLVSLADASGRRYDRIQSSHGQLEVPAVKQGIQQLHGQFTFAKTCEVSAVHRATVQYRVQPPLREWMYKYGLRFKDIPELAWDLVPYSFIVDRLVDIGDAVRGLTNLSDPGIEILGGTTSVSTKTIQSVSVLKQVNSAWVINIVPDVDYQITDSYTRSVWSPTVLNVFPPVSLAGLTKDISSIADLLALVIGRLR